MYRRTVTMELITTASALNQKVNRNDISGTIGFVPTMGALHAGHISLVQRAAAENNCVVVSIFVNPTQFNDKKDLERYPRNLEADLNLLKNSGCHYVFAPAVEEVYPEPDKRRFDFGDLETVMEGRFRPGHFNGVGQVVSRLFDIVNPHRAYFGLKDFQQLAIIKKLVALLHYDIEIVPCPIVREESGLALSSRNELLSPAERKNAAAIYRTLSEAHQKSKYQEVSELISWVIREVNQHPPLDVEYFEIVNELTLQPVSTWDDPGGKIGCIAVWCGKVRLIDNVSF